MTKFERHLSYLNSFFLCRMCPTQYSLLLTSPSLLFSTLPSISHLPICPFFFTLLISPLYFFSLLFPPSYQDMDVKYISKSIGAGLLEAFCHSMGMNIYDVTTNGGYCLCYVAIECSANDAQIVFIQVTEHREGRTLLLAVFNVIERRDTQNVASTRLPYFSMFLLFLSLVPIFDDSTYPSLHLTFSSWSLSLAYYLLTSLTTCTTTPFQVLLTPLTYYSYLRFSNSLLLLRILHFPLNRRFLFFEVC